MKEQTAERIKSIANSHTRALRRLNQTVDYTRDEVIDEAFVHLQEGRQVFLLGVKNTAAIPSAYVHKLERQGFLFHTLDKITEKGRAIYTEIRNPLTARPMTGSSASTCVHIMQGINQLGLGTDGGGSVLAPAISCGLYAIMGKGLGLQGETTRLSTEGIPFQPGIGVIGQNYELCRKAVYTLLEQEVPKRFLSSEQGKIGIIQWRGEEEEWQKDIRENLKEYSWKIFVREKTTKREELSAIYREAVSQTDFLISKEGPVDLYGLGDSVLGGFGQTGRKLQEDGEKYFVKIANLVNATAIAIPGRELAAGYLLMAAEGKVSGMAGIELGQHLAGIVTRPSVFDQYFFSDQTERGFIS